MCVYEEALIVLGLLKVLTFDLACLQALELIRKHNFSTAIFAPGWVYETQDKSEFRMNQDK